MAVGATIIGIEILNPNTVVVKSILLTSISIRGRNLDFYKKKEKTLKINECYVEY